MLFSKIFALSANNLWDEILFWYQNSTIKAFLDALNNDIFNAQAGNYENLSLSASTGQTIKNIILGLAFGTILAAIMVYYTRSTQGKFVRELLRRECFSPEKAVTLRECGFFCNLSVRQELARRGALSKLTRYAEEPSPDEPIDFMTARFYIREDDRYRAEFRYSKKNASVLQTVLTALAGIAAALLLIKGLPYILNIADWLVGLFH